MTTFTIATFNLGANPVERSEDVLEKILDFEADVYALQGINLQERDKVLRIIKLRGYHFHRFDQSQTQTQDSDGVYILLSKLHIMKAEYIKFHATLQDRGVCKYVIRVDRCAPSKKDTSTLDVVTILSAQLETGGSGNGLRQRQLDELNEMAAGKESVIFAGDTSIPSWQHNINIHNKGDRKWFDAWRENGTMANERTSPLDRMDRILFSTGGMKERILKCKDFQLIAPDYFTEDHRKGCIAIFDLEKSV